MKKIFFTLMVTSLFMFNVVSAAPAKNNSEKIKSYIMKIDKEIARKKNEKFERSYKKLTKKEQDNMPLFYKEQLLRSIKGNHVTYYNAHNNYLNSRFEIKDGKTHGVYKLYDENENLKEIGYLESNKIFSGTRKTFYPTGELETTIPYYFGKIVGPHKTYFKSGKLEEITEQNSKGPHGSSKIYYENGRLKEKCTYVNGKEEGMIIGYYPNGKLQTKMLYKHGKKNGETINYYENGNIKSKFFYKNGKEEGVFKNYYSNGKLRGYTTFKNGKVNGKSESFYKNGKKELSATWKNNERNGDYYEYDENGKVVRHLFFVDGKPVKK